MTKRQAIDLIDNHKNALMVPGDMLAWTWLRVIVDQITEDEWNVLLRKAIPILSA